jgi:acyl-CoA synthetase (AMP-forming)/AMP-acid ligase II
MQSRIQTLFDVLCQHARERPDSASHIFLPNGETEQARLTFATLHRQACAVAAELQARGLRGERVVLMFQPGLAFVSSFLGCLAAGAVAVPVYPPKRAEECAHSAGIALAAGARFVLTDAPSRGALARFAQSWPVGAPLESFDWLDDPRAVDERAERFQPLPIASEELAFLQFTSGSTAAPKGVAVTHANLLANERAIRAAFGHGEHTTVVGWLPFHHDMGLVGITLQPLFLGRPCVLMPPAAFIQKPLRWLKAISRYRATTSGGPNFAYEYCVKALEEKALGEGEALDLSSWQVAFSGAEPVRAETVERFTEKLAPFGFRPEAFQPCYGMAEATLLITSVAPSRSPRILDLDAQALGQGRAESAKDGPLVRAVSCGPTWDETRLLIVEPSSGKPLGEGEVGEIWVQGPGVARGYWEAPEATREHFQASPAHLPGERFLRTGDLGFLDHGELFITGRLKSLIIVNGRNHYPHDIEATSVALHPAFRPQAAVFSEELGAEPEVVLVQEVYPHHARKVVAEELAQLIRRNVLATHGLKLTQVVLTTSRIPVTTSGKVRRAACREEWRAGRLVLLGAPRPTLSNPSQETP